MFFWEYILLNRVYLIKGLFKSHNDREGYFQLKTKTNLKAKFTNILVDSEKLEI